MLLTPKQDVDQALYNERAMEVELNKRLLARELHKRGMMVLGHLEIDPDAIPRQTCTVPVEWRVYCHRTEDLCLCSGCHRPMCERHSCYFLAEEPDETGFESKLVDFGGPICVHCEALVRIMWKLSMYPVDAKKLEFDELCEQYPHELGISLSQDQLMVSSFDEGDESDELCQICTYRPCECATRRCAGCGDVGGCECCDEY